jgi:predicted CoA-binding protein
MAHENPTDKELEELLTSSSTIAVVGASANPDRDSHGIMKQLQRAGFTVIPVNPRESEILGERAYPSLSGIPIPVDIVDVFRRPEDTPSLADEAVRIHARAFWLPEGVVSEEAMDRAKAGKLIAVMNLCIGATVWRLGIKRPA